jgi:uncharacterized membrane protein YgcG
MSPVIDLKSMLSRRWLYLVAWILLLASVFIPAPSGFYPIDPSEWSGLKFLGEDALEGSRGMSAAWIIGKVFHWSRQKAGTSGAMDFAHMAVLTLGFLSNVAFLLCAFLLDYRRVSAATKVLLVAAVGIAGSVAFMFPIFARMPAYWLWVASLAMLAWSFIAFEGRGVPGEGASARRADASTGHVPLVVWMWLGFAAFWLAITWIGASHVAAPVGIEEKSDVAAPKALESYFNDVAHLIAPDAAGKLNATLAAFDKDTSNQIAVAIYPRSPSGSIEEFTIDIADRSRLGRKGLDNGAILFVFTEVRTARLEVGYGLDGVLTDALAHRILEQRLMPAFARGDFAAGLDATLNAVFETVRDGRSQGRMPGQLALLWRQVTVASPKLMRQAWPALLGLDFLQRLVISFFGGAFATIACYVLREVVRDAYYLGRLARNAVAPRPGGAAIERIRYDAILEKLKLMGFTLEVIVGSAGFALAAIASVAGIVIIAAGGGFGGAGATVRW